MKHQAIRVPAAPPSVFATHLAILLGLAFAVLQALASPARGAPDSFADLAETVSPAVVNITTTSMVSVRTTPFPMLPEGSPFEEFFNRNFNRNRPDGERPRRRNQALGSGFVISEDGFVVTNNHVIESADEVLVEFFSGEKLPAEVIGADPNTDIALLKVESDEPLPFVTFGDSDTARVGDWVMAVGNPLGQGFSVSAGIISARGRALSGSYDDFIQTDAAINRGNSGGPLFNIDGEVIGVNTSILSPTGGSIGIGFAMSSVVVEPVVAQLKAFGETRRGWLGVRIQDVTDDVAEALGLEKTAGALVTDVPDGPAAEAGVEAGDVITSFDGQDVTDTRDLIRTVGNTEVGKAVRVVVFRDGETQTILVTLGRRETAEGLSGGDDDADQPKRSIVLGLTLQELGPDMREAMDLPEDAEGLIVSDVDPDSTAHAKGVRSGDLLTQVGQHPLRQVSDLTDLITEAREAGRTSVLILIRRGDDPNFVALPLDE